MSKKKIKYRIDYYSAVHWLNPSLVMLNNINEIDENFWENIPCTETEIYQYFITSFSDFDVEFMKKRFPDIILAKSEKLDTWILCVDHWGTAWDYVFTDLIPDEDGLMLPNEDAWDKDGKATRHWELSKTAKFQKI